MDLSLTFALFYLVSGVPVKAALLARTRAVIPGRLPFYLLSPVFASASWRRARAWLADHGFMQLRRALFFVPLGVGSWLGFRALQGSTLDAVWLPFIGILPFYLLLEALGALLQAVFGLFGIRLPNMHRHPLASRTLSDFWGRRWNLWVGEWLRAVGFTPLRRHPAAATMLVFLVSGLWHEFTFNLPYYLIADRALFGDMTLYFLLQGLGVLIDHRLPRQVPLLRRAFAWAVVVGPAPLVLNEATLKIFLLQL